MSEPADIHPIADASTVARAEALKAHEAVIEHGIHTFVEVGQALMAIRDGRLYKGQGYKSFSVYCTERWGWRREYADRLVGAAGVVANLTPIGGTLPANEAQARELAKLPDVDAQVEVWKEARESAPDGRVTASLIAEVAERRAARDPAYGAAQSQRGYDPDEYYTPQEYIDAARKVMGGIDLDPATCAFAQQRIQATRYYTVTDNGLEQPWNGRVWLNPPYSLGTEFADKLLEEFEAGRTTQAAFLQNAGTDTGWFHSVAARGHLCLTKGRISFDRTDGPRVSNRYGQVFFYLGKRVARFEKVFKQFGLVGRLR